MTAEFPPEFVVRATTRTDVAALNAFIDPFVQEGRLLPRTHDELADLTRHGFAAILPDGRIVGFAALEIYSKKLGELRSLAVDPEYRRHGIGKALVQACLNRAKEEKVFEVMTITSADDFFHKCGFEFTLPGERKALFHQTRDTY
jgi:amino-acid N-acetyltransferase